MIHGLNIHGDPANVAKSTELIRDLRVTSLRDTLSWSRVEVQQGEFALAPLEQAKLSLLESLGKDNAVPLCYGNPLYGVGELITQADRENFIRYVEWIVPRLRHTVKYFEIWNEWNGGLGFLSGQYAARTSAQRIASYYAVCRDVYPVIKRLAPECIVLGLVVSWLDQDYIQASIDSGVLQYMDAVALHTYNDAGSVVATPEHAIARLDYTQGLLTAANGGRPVDCYLTEMGWASYSTAKHTASDVARYLPRFYNACEKRPWVKGVWWYNLFNNGPGDTMFNRYGLTTNVGAYKPVYFAYRGLINRDRKDQYGWCRVAMVDAIETAINGGTLPDRPRRALRNLRSTGTTVVINTRTLRVMTGPIDLSVLDDVGERFTDDFVIIEGPVVRGQVPAQTTATRDSTWPNGWA